MIRKFIGSLTILAIGGVVICGLIFGFPETLTKIGGWISGLAS